MELVVGIWLLGLIMRLYDWLDIVKLISVFDFVIEFVWLIVGSGIDSDNSGIFV